MFTLVYQNIDMNKDYYGKAVSRPKGEIPMTNLLRESHIGDWCKRGAWIILVIGVLNIVVGIYTAIQQSSAGGAPLSYTIADVLQGVFSIASPTLFYFLVLYSAGLVLNRFAAAEEVAVPEMAKEDEEPAQTQVR
jgi:hypothetical protein